MENRNPSFPQNIGNKPEKVSLPCEPFDASGEPSLRWTPGQYDRFCHFFCNNKTSCVVSTLNYCISSTSNFASFKWMGCILLPLSSCWSHICRVWLLQRYWEWFEINLWRPSYLHVTWGDCQGRLSGWTYDRRDGKRIGTWRIRNIFYQGHQTKPSRMCAILLFFFRCVNSFVCLQRASSLETLLTVSEGGKM